jgi:hypothetical protein
MPVVIPPNPNLLALVTEGINQAGEYNPSSTLLNRAQNEWIEEIKNEIWHLSKKPKILHVTAYAISNKGQSRYAFPKDYSSDLFLTLLWGSFTGTCQGGSTNTITLATNDVSGDNVIGKEILMMSGGSAGSYAQIVNIDATIPSAKVANMIPNFNVAPSPGDTYMIIDVEYPVETRPIWDWEARQKLVAPGLPQFLYPLGDDQEGYFVFNCPPDFTRGMRLRYYSDISQLDVNSTLMSVLYRKWRNIWIKGIKFRKLADENDDLAPAAQQDYKMELRNLIYREMYGMDISNLTDRIMDFDFGALDNYGGAGGTKW